MSWLKLLLFISYLVPECLTDQNYEYLIQTFNKNESTNLDIAYVLRNNLVYSELSNVFSEPNRLESLHDKLYASLSIRPYQYNTGVFSINTRAYCFRDVCNIPGPTIYLHPGDELQ